MRRCAPVSAAGKPRRLGAGSGSQAHSTVRWASGAISPGSGAWVCSEACFEAAVKRAGTGPSTAPRVVERRDQRSSRETVTKPKTTRNRRDLGQGLAIKKIRVYELARELGVENLVVVELATELKLGVKSPSSSIDEPSADHVRRLADSKGLRREPEPEPAPTGRARTGSRRDAHARRGTCARLDWKGYSGCTARARRGRLRPTSSPQAIRRHGGSSFARVVRSSVPPPPRPRRSNVPRPPMRRPPPRMPAKLQPTTAGDTGAAKAPTGRAAAASADRATAPPVRRLRRNVRCVREAAR